MNLQLLKVVYNILWFVIRFEGGYLPTLSPCCHSSGYSIDKSFAWVIGKDHLKTALRISALSNLRTGMTM